MKRRTLFPTLGLAVSLALFTLAGASCSSEEPEDNTGGTGGSLPAVPVFKGLDEARSSKHGQGAAVRLYWWPAKSEAPVEEIKYTVRVWSRDPATPGAGEPEVQDATPLKLPCSNRCTFTWADNVSESVRWFSVEAKLVVKGEGEEEVPLVLESDSGVVMPAVIWLTEPELTEVGPSPVGRGEMVTVKGGHFLDQPMSPDALQVGGVPVLGALISSWNNDQIRFVVPEGAVSGPIQVTTPAGTGTSAATLEVQ